MPVSAAGRVAVEYVRQTLRSDAERIQSRTVLGVYGIPAGTLRLGTRRVIRSGLWTAVRSGICVAMVLVCLAGSVAGRTEHLVVLRPTPRFGQSCPHPGRISVRRAGSKMPLGPTVARPVVVRPVYRHQLPVSPDTL